LDALFDQNTHDSSIGIVQPPFSRPLPAAALVRSVIGTSSAAGREAATALDVFNWRPGETDQALSL
jgi:hypothetical protein